MELNIKDLKIEPFIIHFDDTEKITLKPPKLTDIAKAAELQGKNDYNGAVEFVQAILSNNKEGKEITAEFIEKNFDVVALEIIMTKFVEWIERIKKNPNL